MDILYLLIPLSTLMVLAILGLFAWALNGGQFDELSREGERILSEAPDIAPETAPNLDIDQALPTTLAEESRQEQIRL